MFIHRKIVLSVFLVQFAASAALANHLETSPTGSHSPRKWSAYPHHVQNLGNAIVSNSHVDWESISGSAVWPQSDAGREQNAIASTCPWLEGYPDCHPDDLYQRDIQPARQHPITGPARRQLRPQATE